jgi:uncharacterized protein YecE (DUF72 family)
VRVRVGCSGWNYRSWAGDLYPKGCPPRDWLPVYAENFDVVEVNTTFYRLPNRDAVARWVQQVPDGFLFAVKSSRFLTHMKRLTDMDRGVDRLLERLEPLTASPKMGPMLWQLPDRFARDDERLRFALERLPPHIHHAFELRHPSWHDPYVLDMLREHGVAHVIHHDPRRPDPPHEITADISYVRLHFGARGRRGNYSDAELAEWARRIARWREQAAVFVFLNNDWEGFAPRNAKRLRGLLEEAG